MTKFGEKLLADIQKTYAVKLANDKRLKRLGKKVAKSADYNVVNDYAVRCGELLSESILENTETLAYMSKETAEEVLPPMLTADYELITAATDTVQTNMNAAYGVGLGVQTPALDTNRISGIVDKVASYADMESARWMLGEPIVNYSQAVVDQAIHDNARVGSKAGKQAIIIRETEGRETRRIKRGKSVATYTIPCRWCDSLAGRYNYEDVKDTGNNVFRRHENCRCHVTYVYGDRREDVWSKKAQAQKDTEQQQQIVNEALERQNGSYYPTELAGVERGEPMTVAEADSGNVNPNYDLGGGYRINCQSCVVTYEARLRGYDVEVLPNTAGSKLRELSHNTALAWRNADGSPAQYLIGSREQWMEMNRNKKYFTATSFEKELRNTLQPNERYHFGFPWRGRGNSGHIVTLDISNDGVLHIYDPQVDRNYYGDEVSQYLKRIKYTQTLYGEKAPASVEVMRVDDKSFDLDVCDYIMKAK